MCKWGTYKDVKLAYPKECSGRTVVPVDSCIAKVIQKLNDEKIYTKGCCCGHGKSDPDIVIDSSGSNEDIMKILNSIKEIDNRNWKIIQWRIRIVGQSKTGLEDNIVPNHLWYKDK